MVLQVQDSAGRRVCYPAHRPRMDKRRNKQPRSLIPPASLPTMFESVAPAEPIGRDGSQFREVYAPDLLYAVAMQEVF